MPCCLLYNRYIGKSRMPSAASAPAFSEHDISRLTDPEFAAGSETSFADGFPMLLASEVRLLCICCSKQDCCSALVSLPCCSCSHPCALVEHFKGFICISRLLLIALAEMLRLPTLQEDLADLNAHLGGRITLTMARFRCEIHRASMMGLLNKAVYNPLKSKGANAPWVCCESHKCVLLLFMPHTPQGAP